MKKDKAYLNDMLDAISDIEMFIANISELVWQTVKNKIPELKNQLLKISEEQNG